MQTWGGFIHNLGGGGAKSLGGQKCIEMMQDQTPLPCPTTLGFGMQGSQPAHPGPGLSMHAFTISARTRALTACPKASVKIFPYMLS